ncbi:MAG: hypothetical protein ACLSHM_01570 [Vescimonas sp.]
MAKDYVITATGVYGANQGRRDPESPVFLPGKPANTSGYVETTLRPAPTTTASTGWL